MSMFTTTRGPDASFANLFRLLDDFDLYSRETQQNNQSSSGHSHRRPVQPARSFNARFDIRETDSAFELYGELPGANRDQIQIEFVDDHGITVRGRIDRAYHNNNNVNEDGKNAAAATTESGDDKEQTVAKKGSDALAAHAFDKLWLAERSVGEFSRTFTFPTRLDHEGVSASLDKGILSILVPKAKKMEARRIAIN